MRSVAEYITDLFQNLKNIISGDWLVCTILCLEDYGAGFMADKAVPAARFDGHAAVGSTGGDGHLLGDVAIVIVEILGGTPPKNHHCLCRLAMAMNRQHRPRLQRIGHALGAILNGGTHIEIHPYSMYGRGKISYILLQQRVVAP